MKSSRNYDVSIDYDAIASQLVDEYKIAEVNPAQRCSTLFNLVQRRRRVRRYGSKISFSPNNRSAVMPRERHVSIRRVDWTIGFDFSVYLMPIT
jgi:hypothetical protein